MTALTEEAVLLFRALCTLSRMDLSKLNSQPPGLERPCQEDKLATHSWVSFP